MSTVEAVSGYDERLAEKIGNRLKRVFSDPIFDDPAMAKKISGPMPQLEMYLEMRRQILQERDSLCVTDFLKPCYEEPLLTSEQEAHQFRKYSYHKHKAKQFLESKNLRAAAVELKKSDVLKRSLTSANVRLVIPLVRPYLKDRRHCEDIVSEAYCLILRSVDYFDWRLNNKFSTYATWVVRRGIGRVAQHIFTNDDRFRNADDFEFDNKTSKESGYEEEIRYQKMVDLIDKVLTTFCNEREQDILRMRFLEGKTLEEVGEVFGVTKERIRQLQSKALERIRENIEIDDVDFVGLFSETY